MDGASNNSDDEVEQFDDGASEDAIGDDDDMAEAEYLVDDEDGNDEVGVSSLPLSDCSLNRSRNLRQTRMKKKTRMAHRRKTMRNIHQPQGRRRRREQLICTSVSRIHPPHSQPSQDQVCHIQSFAI
jgi:hypothetical protein